MSSDLTRREVLKVGASVAASPMLPVLTERVEAQSASLTSPNTRTLTFRLNGASLTVAVEPRVSLLDLLRERLELTGTKKGCNEGACGACTVFIDGQRMNACLTLAVQVEGQHVTTIEGLSGPNDALHPVQQAFIDHDAFQCGFCTPGQVMSAVACIREGRATSAANVREFMSGNLCRCSAYPQITSAVLAAAERCKG